MNARQWQLKWHYCLPGHLINDAKNDTVFHHWYLLFAATGWGSFAYGDNSVPVESWSVKNTNGFLSLQKVTVEKGKSGTILITHSKDGILTAFGLFVKTDSGGVSHYIHTRQKKAFSKSWKPLVLVARPEGFEPPTYGFEERKLKIKILL